MRLTVVVAIAVVVAAIAAAAIVAAGTLAASEHGQYLSREGSFVREEISNTVAINGIPAVGIARAKPVASAIPKSIAALGLAKRLVQQSFPLSRRLGWGQ